MGNRWGAVIARLLQVAGIVLYAYVVGGAVVSLRLRAAGLPSGPDSLTLVPHDQLLATGARALLFWTGFTAVLGGSAVALVELVSRASRIVSTWRKLRAARASIARLIPYGVAIAAVGGMAVGSIVVIAPGQRPGPASETVVLAFTLFVLLATTVYGDTLRKRARMWHFAILVAVVSGALALAQAWDGPTKLSVAVVETGPGNCVAGPIVAHADDGAYFADGRAQAIVFIREEAAGRFALKSHKVNASHASVSRVRCPSAFAQ